MKVCLIASSGGHLSQLFHIREAFQKYETLWITFPSQDAQSLLKNDGSLLELLDSQETFLNETLATHYGIKGVQGREMRRVALLDRKRGGFDLISERGIL